jgi:hypothetical protein
MNYLRTAILLAGLTALFMGVGYLIGGPNGALIALLIAAGMNLFSYWNADKLVLSMHGAQEVDERTAREVVGLVRELAQRAGLPMPRVYLMDNPQPNAFATGRNPEHAAVAITTGLLNMLTRGEVAGVIAHELNRDTLTMTITATIAGAISMLAQFGFFFGGGRRGSHCAPLHRQPAHRAGDGQSVLHAPFHREPDRGARRTCARDGPRRLRQRHARSPGIRHRSVGKRRRARPVGVRARREPTSIKSREPGAALMSAGPQKRSNYVRHSKDRDVPTADSCTAANTPLTRSPKQRQPST